MKTCPQCETQYDDYMRFCLQDGTPLVGGDEDNPTEAITEIYAAPRETNPQQIEAVTEQFDGQNESQETFTAINKERSAQKNDLSNAPTLVESETQRSGSGAILGTLLLGGLVLLGSAIGGIFWYLSSQNSNEIASANSTQTNSANLNNEDQDPNFEISNANLPAANTDLNKKNSPTPVQTVLPKPIETKTPQPTPTAENKPTPQPTAEKSPTPKPTVERPSRPVSGGVLNSKATNLPRPTYPPAARVVRASGAVNVRVLVDENGNVTAANAISGHPLLKNSAERAARNAKFRPTMLNGQAVKVSGVIVYNFQ